MMRVATWNPTQYDGEFINASMNRIKIAAEIVADKARRDAPVGSISRPVYKKGAYAGASWTARKPGSLKKTIRVVEKPGVNNIWVMAGNYDVFYARLYEYNFKPFLRNALWGSEQRIRMAVETGSGETGTIAQFMKK